MIRPILASVLFTVFFSSFALAKETSLATYNIRNFDYDRRANQTTNKSALKDIVGELKAEIIAIQEVVNKEEFSRFIQTTMPQYSVSLSQCGGMGKQHLGIIYKADRFQIESTMEDDRISRGEGCDKGLRPAMIYKINDKKLNTKLHLIVVHLKAGGTQRNDDERYAQLQVLTKIVSELKTKGTNNVVIMGDFNTTDYVLRNQNYQRFMDFVETNQLVDLSSEVECTSYWWGGTDDGFEDASILDHILVSRDMFDNVDTRKIETTAHCKKAKCESAAAEILGISFKEVSDHCPMVASFTF